VIQMPDSFNFFQASHIFKLLRELSVQDRGATLTKIRLFV
jgi:hypothetical protein